MNLREALFLSSVSKATYTHGLPTASPTGAFCQYQVQVAITEEEYQIRTIRGPETATRYTYTVTVSRVEGEKVYPPHVTHDERSLDNMLSYLEAWGVGAEYLDPWHPVEQWDSPEGGQDAEESARPRQSSTQAV